MMNENYELRILTSFDELIAINDENHKKIISFYIDQITCGLLIYTENESRISFFKLSIKEFITNEKDNAVLQSISGDDCFDGEKFKISLLVCIVNLHIYLLFYQFLFICKFYIFDV